MFIIDTHCHFDDYRFGCDRKDAYRRAREAGVIYQVNPAIKAEWWPNIKSTCNSFPGIFPAYGLHPMFMQDHKSRHLEKLDQWLSDEPAVAVGECGLDFYIEAPQPEKQRKIFEAQLDLAMNHQLPVIIHARKSVEEMIMALKRHPGIRGVLHSYSGSLVQARRLVEMGFMLGFGGPTTYSNAHKLHKLIKALPIESILLETDAPDQPNREQRGKRNEPARLPFILEQIAQLKALSPEALASHTTRNACNLFNLPVPDQSE